VQNLRDFPQTQRDRDVNAPYLLNKDGGLYFLFHKNIANIMLFSLKKKNIFVGRKKRYNRKPAQNH